MSSTTNRIDPASGNDNGLDTRAVAACWHDREPFGNAAIVAGLSRRTRLAVEALLADSTSTSLLTRGGCTAKEVAEIMAHVTGGTAALPAGAGTGLHGLHEFSTLHEVQLALEAWAAEITPLPRPAKAIQREQAVAILKTVKAVSSPSRLVDSFLPAGDAPASGGVSFADVEPADEPQDTGTLLADLSEAFRTYIVFPAGAEVVLAAWALHTWILDSILFTPRLLFTSPTKRCGKTLALDVLQAVCSLPLMSANLSSAVLYRAVEAWRPTLLVDEADTFLGDNEELRGVLNAGFRHDGVVLRCDGEDLEPKAFKCFSPVAIASIGAMASTISDRALTIRMSRRSRAEEIARFDRRARALLATFPPRLARWAEDNKEALRDATPAAPEGLNDRQRDIVEPLLAIADLAGGRWPTQVRGAVLAQCGAAADDATDRRERLLAAVWGLYTPGTAFLALKSIVERLLEEEDAEWHEAAKGKPLNAVWLARWLTPYGLKSTRIRATGRERGYRREDVAPVAAKYLPPAGPPDLPGTPGTGRDNPAEPNSESASSLTRDTPAVVPGKNQEKPNGIAAVPGGPGKSPPIPTSARNVGLVAEALPPVGEPPAVLDDLARFLEIDQADAEAELCRLVAMGLAEQVWAEGGRPAWRLPAGGGAP